MEFRKIQEQARNAEEEENTLGQTSMDIVRVDGGVGDTKGGEKLHPKINLFWALRGSKLVTNLIQVNLFIYGRVY